MMAKSFDNGLNIGLEVVNITINHLHRKTSPELLNCCGELLERGGMDGCHMILEQSPNLFNGVQLRRAWWKLKKPHSFLVSPLSNHPCFLLAIIVLDKKPVTGIVPSYSRQDMLHKQVAISLSVQLPLEDGDATGAPPGNCAKDKSLWPACRAFKPLVPNFLPFLGPNMASGL